MTSFQAEVPGPAAPQGSAAAGHPTLWLDVEDLFHYAARNPRPSGIQRLSFELYAQLHALRGDNVRFCRHDPMSRALRTVPWHIVQSLFDRMLAPPTPPPAPLPPGLLRRTVRRLPLELRHLLGQAAFSQRAALSTQWAALSYGGQALRFLSLALRGPGSQNKPSDQPPAPEPLPYASNDMRDEVRPGDILAILGSPWFQPSYAELIEQATKGQSLRTALLVYDLIPLLRPEWCNGDLVAAFRTWFTALAPRMDMLFAISAATARDVERWAVRNGVAIAQPVRTLPIGTGFSEQSSAPAASLPSHLQPGSFVLFVSTIEARKNHTLAFRVWRRLLEEMPPEQVPTLVFAGRVGWLVADLMQQLENCAYLDGKVMIMPDPTDAELTTLYRSCRFTLFPSLYEGWGLPVSESLSFGKLCVASDRSSVPEAGGPFCLYFDPENVSAAVNVIRRACTDNDLVAAHEARIAESFRPTSWHSTATTLLSQLGLASD